MNCRDEIAFEMLYLQQISRNSFFLVRMEKLKNSTKKSRRLKKLSVSHMNNVNQKISLRANDFIDEILSKGSEENAHNNVEFVDQLNENNEFLMIKWTAMYMHLVWVQLKLK